MKTTSKKPRIVAQIATGPAEEFVGRSLARARKLDRGERLPSEIRLTFEDPADLRINTVGPGKDKPMGAIK